jgi:hypothetical protein
MENYSSNIEDTVNSNKCTIENISMRGSPEHRIGFIRMVHIYVDVVQFLRSNRFCFLKC